MITRRRFLQSLGALAAAVALSGAGAPTSKAMATPTWNHDWVDVWGDPDNPPESYLGFRDRDVLQMFIDAVNERILAQCEMANQDYASTKLDDAPADHAYMTSLWADFSGHSVRSGLYAGDAQWPIRTHDEDGTSLTYMNAGNVWMATNPDIDAPAPQNDTDPTPIYNYKFQIMRQIADVDSTTPLTAALPDGTRVLFVGASNVAGNGDKTGKILLKSDGAWALDPVRNTDSSVPEYGFPDLVDHFFPDVATYVEEPAGPNDDPGTYNDPVANAYWLNKMRDRINVTVGGFIPLADVFDGGTWCEIVTETNSGVCQGYEIDEDGEPIRDGNGYVVLVTSEAAAKAIAGDDFASMRRLNAGGGFAFGNTAMAVAKSTVRDDGASFTAGVDVFVDMYTAAVTRMSLKIVIHNLPTSFAGDVFFGLGGKGTDSVSDGSVTYGLTSFSDPVYDLWDTVNDRADGRLKTILTGAGVAGPGDWTSSTIGSTTAMPSPWPSLAEDPDGLYVNRGYVWWFEPAGGPVCLIRFDGAGGFTYKVP